MIELTKVINLNNNFSLENIKRELSRKIPKPLPTPLYARVNSNGNKALYNEIITDGDNDIKHELLLPIEFALVESCYENTDHFILSCVRYLINDVLRIFKHLKPLLNENQSNLMSCYVDNTLVLIGQRKDTNSNENIETMLIKKTGRLHHAYYDKVPIMFCFIVNGNLIEFLIYKRGMKVFIFK